MPRVNWNKFVPDIDKKIENLLKKLRFQPEVSPRAFVKKTKGEKHRYSSVCLDSEGKKLIFYARLHNNKDAKRKMITEILLAKDTKMLNKLSCFPKYYQSGIAKGFEWFSREYIKESPLGDNEKLNKKVDSKQAKILAKALWQISQLAPNFRNHHCLKKTSPSEYLKSKQMLKNYLDKKIINKALYKKGNVLFEETKELIRKEHKYICHGDVNLGNLIFQKNNLKIIDWESIHIDNFAFDVGYFFTHLWQAPRSFRKALVKNYLTYLPKKKTRNFKSLFRLVILYLCLDGIFYKPKGIKNKQQLKKRRRFFKNLLKNSILGFEEIIET